MSTHDMQASAQNIFRGGLCTIFCTRSSASKDECTARRVQRVEGVLAGFILVIDLTLPSWGRVSIRHPCCLSVESDIR